MVEDEDLLMAVLNSAPVIEGTPTDQLAGSTGRELAGEHPRELLRRFGGLGTDTERLHLKRTRAALQAMVRGDADAVEPLAAATDNAVLVPEVTCGGLHWHLDAPADERLSARTVLAWSRVMRELPGRLRPCANTECNLFLLDHSRPGKAKWCSMAACGNRMKARAFAQRARR
ncbi:CGNR zinc finger domain-containing protein [Nocardiopsis oceani]